MVERSVTTSDPLAPLRGWSTCSARKLLPVPVSPSIKTGRGDRASTVSFCRKSAIDAERPQKMGPSSAALWTASAREISAASVRESTTSFSQNCTSGSRVSASVVVSIHRQLGVVAPEPLEDVEALLAARVLELERALVLRQEPLRGEREVEIEHHQVGQRLGLGERIRRL